MTKEEAYYGLIANVITNNATQQERLQLLALCDEDEAVQQLFVSLSAIYQTPAPAKAPFNTTQALAIFKAKHKL
jgi:hypothetical protein